MYIITYDFQTTFPSNLSDNPLRTFWKAFRATSLEARWQPTCALRRFMNEIKYLNAMNDMNDMKDVNDMDAMDDMNDMTT